MYAAIRNVLLIFAALLPIVNPLGMAPIFAAITLGYPEKVRRTVALRVAVNGVALLVASLFVGGYILQFFGISLAAVQVGGVHKGVKPAVGNRFHRVFSVGALEAHLYSTNDRGFRNSHRDVPRVDGQS